MNQAFHSHTAPSRWCAARVADGRYWVWSVQASAVRHVVIAVRARRAAHEVET